jgi:signal transduction histidine kinase
VVRLFFILVFIFHLLSFGININFNIFPQIVIIPLFAMILLGRKDGLLLSISYLASVSVISIFILRQEVIVLDYMQLFLAVLLVAVLALMDGYFYETVRQNASIALVAKQHDLEDATIRAEKANKAKSEFLANMSHELRTPLNHIIGFNELILDGNLGAVTPEQKEYLQDALSSSYHLLSLINDILDMAKIESGKMNLEIGDVVVDEVVQRSIATTRGQFEKKRITIDHSIACSHPSFQGDERKIRQVLYNLLANAAKFTPSRGCITLSVNDYEESFVLFSVRDTGIGIEQKDLERIFIPFDQLDNTVTREYAGTGLGLSLSRSIVELHGGRIWAESEGRNKGATLCFTVSLSHDR